MDPHEATRGGFRCLVWVIVVARLAFYGCHAMGWMLSRLFNYPIQMAVRLSPPLMRLKRIIDSLHACWFEKPVLVDCVPDESSFLVPEGHVGPADAPSLKQCAQLIRSLQGPAAARELCGDDGTCSDSQGPGGLYVSLELQAGDHTAVGLPPGCCPSRCSAGRHRAQQQRKQQSQVVWLSLSGPL